ncbi:MAG TPA: GNAT family N-acetyltransferase [Nitrosopumilaceae archaeon]|nr:GNAT family N-acetyltransferase [Nitrosopumilaceae archaeon]
MECGTLFANEKLPNDIFFDKLTNITCLSEKMIDEAIALFKKYNTQPYVYVLDNPDLEKMLVKKGFVLYDTQHVLTKNSDSNLEHSAMHHVAKKDSLLWAEIFCKSYDCLEWIDEVNSIVRNSVSQIEYLVDSEHNASCVALYEKNSILGLYCLGTIPEYRKRGLGKSLINYALTQVKRKNLDFLMLETYEKDNLIEFYSNLGFEKIYEKKVYSI